MAVRWTSFLNLSRLFLALALLLLTASFFQPSFVVTQEAENSDGKATQTYEFNPLYFQEELDTDLDPGTFNKTSGVTTYNYHNERLSTVTLAISVLLVVSYLGPIIILFLAVNFNPFNRKKNLFSLLLFFSIFFSLIILASIFFFIVPQYVHQEIGTPMGFDPAMPLPAFGGQQGEYLDIGVGSELDPLIGRNNFDETSFKVSWAPGLALYLYIGAAIMTLAGFRFFSKAHSLSLSEAILRKKRSSKEEEDEEDEEDDEVIMAEIDDVFDSVLADLDEGSEDEEPKKKEKKKGKKSKKKKGKKGRAEEKEPEPEEPKVEEEPKEEPPEIEEAPDLTTPEDEPKKPKTTSEPEVRPALKDSSSKEKKIIEIGSKDFEDKLVEIEEEDSVTIECPMCSNKFTIGKNEKYVVCNKCGFTGDVG